MGVSVSLQNASLGDGVGGTAETQDVSATRGGARSLAVGFSSYKMKVRVCLSMNVWICHMIRSPGKFRVDAQTSLWYSVQWSVKIFIGARYTPCTCNELVVSRYMMMYILYRFSNVERLLYLYWRALMGRWIVELRSSLIDISRFHRSFMANSSFQQARRFRAPLETLLRTYTTIRLKPPSNAEEVRQAIWIFRIPCAPFCRFGCRLLGQVCLGKLADSSDSQERILYNRSRPSALRGSDHHSLPPRYASDMLLRKGRCFFFCKGVASLCPDR